MGSVLRLLSEPLTDSEELIHRALKDAMPGSARAEEERAALLLLEEGSLYLAGEKYRVALLF